MTEMELLEAMARLPDDTLVGLACDAEGNDGEVGFRELTPELRRQGYTDEDVLEGVPCIVLHPA